MLAYIAHSSWKYNNQASITWFACEYMRSIPLTLVFSRNGRRQRPTPKCTSYCCQKRLLYVLVIWITPIAKIIGIFWWDHPWFYCFVDFFDAEVARDISCRRQRLNVLRFTTRLNCLFPQMLFIWELKWIFGILELFGNRWRWCGDAKKSFEYSSINIICPWNMFM